MRPPREKAVHPVSLFRALCLFCAAAPNAFQKDAGVLTVTYFQATNYILDGARLITCHPGSQVKGGACSGHVRLS